MSETETARVAAQVSSLGEETLKKLGTTLSIAVAKNETDIPCGILSSLSVPDASKLNEVVISSVVDSPFPSCFVAHGPCREALTSHLVASKEQAGEWSPSPVEIHWVHVRSVFVKVR